MRFLATKTLRHKEIPKDKQIAVVYKNKKLSAFVS